MIDRDRPVRVFKNEKAGCYTIMQRGRILASARQVLLRDVEFNVRQSGRERMLRLRKKNVHAYAVGKLVDFVHPDDSRDLGPIEGRQVRYNPYQFAYFVDSEHETPVRAANLVQLDEHRVTYQQSGADLVALDKAS